jgi:NAD(P)-dependent dehydrogenase (short-subunit alcohol dehydrogenase family)
MHVSRPVCLVSGSSSGIGAAIVREFSAHGYDVVINYNSGADRAARIAAELTRDFGTAPLVLEADLSEPEGAFRLVDAAWAHFGRLDVLVSNSGVSSYVAGADGALARFRFHQTPVDHLEREFERVLELNLKGAYRLAQRGLHYMMQQAEEEHRHGRQPAHRSILFITSVSDVAPESTRIPYGVSKAALNHAVLGAALEAGPHNITVNGLRPGVVDTPLTARPSGVRDPDDGHEYTVAEVYALMAEGGSQAIRRIGRPADIAGAAFAFTQIPYMTGQLIAVDGGFTLASAFVNRDVFVQEGFRRRRLKLQEPGQGDEKKG